MRLIVRWAALAAAIWLVSLLLGDHLVVKGDWLTFAGIALILGIVNAVVGTFLKVVTFPLTILSLGLWLLVINASMLLLTDYFSDAMQVSSFWWAVAASVLISIVSTIINKVGNRSRKN